MFGVVAVLVFVGNDIGVVFAAVPVPLLFMFGIAFAVAALPSFFALATVHVTTVTGVLVRLAACGALLFVVAVAVTGARSRSALATARSTTRLADLRGLLPTAVSGGEVGGDFDGEAD